MNAEPARRRIPYATYFFFLILFALIVFFLHAPLLRLPYYWDELGQFVPAALDIFHHGEWIPHSAVPNVHPPGVMAYLAAFWTIAGYSIAGTRLAMLTLASFAVLAAFLLAIELCRNVRGAPAFMAVFLLCASPLFFAQAMLAQLDLPAMLFTTLGLLFFLQNKMRLAVLACTLLVLAKETGLLMPALFAAWLLLEKRRREAAWFAVPAAVLAVWLVLLAHATGHWFGNAEFTRYNLYYPWHPVRIALAVARRLYYLFFQDFHWIGAIGIVFAWRRGVYGTRAWKLAWAAVALHVIFLSVAGGAMLERYLLPVLPVMYAAMMAGMSIWRQPLRLICQLALLAGLIAGNFWNPPYSFPFENNLAFTDFVELQKTAAEVLERQAGGQVTATAWPLSAALRRPEFGYVRRPLPVRQLESFSAESIDNPGWQQDAELLVLYSRSWNPAWSWNRLPPVRYILRRFYDYQPELTGSDMAHRPFTLLERWERRGQWIEIYQVNRASLAAAPADRTAECSARRHR